MEKTIIGTHDSITAHPPRKWWMMLLKPFAVTQDKTIYQQYMDGVRCFDLRVRLGKADKRAIYDKWVMCHGLYEVEASIYEVIDNLRDFAIADNTTIYIRIVLENLKIDDHEAERFIKLCEFLDKFYENVIFICGNRKSDWAQLYQFSYPNQQQWMPVSSCAEDARWYERLLPRVYAKRMNKHNLLNIPSKYGFAFFDFI